jgi:hypothetical protein
MTLYFVWEALLLTFAWRLITSSLPRAQLARQGRSSAPANRG